MRTSYSKLTKSADDDDIIKMSIQFAKTVPTKEYNARYSDYGNVAINSLST